MGTGIQLRDGVPACMYKGLGSFPAQEKMATMLQCVVCIQDTWSSMPSTKVNQSINSYVSLDKSS